MTNPYLYTDCEVDLIVTLIIYTYIISYIIFTCRFNPQKSSLIGKLQISCLVVGTLKFSMDNEVHNDKLVKNEMVFRWPSCLSHISKKCHFP